MSWNADTRGKEGQRPGSNTPVFSSMVSSYVTLARVCLQSGAYREAESYARKALSSSTIPVALPAIILAEALWRQGRHDEAQDTRLHIEVDKNDEYLQSELTLLDVRLLVERGLCRDCLQRFGHLESRSAPTIADIQVIMNLAQCHARLDDLVASRRGFERTLLESSRLGWSEGVARSYMQLALLDRTEGSWARAVSLLSRAKDSFARLGLFRSYVLASVNLGLQHLWLGNLSSAEETLTEAARMSAEMGDIRVESTARADLGLALARLRRFAEARSELTHALRLARRQASPRRLAIALEYTGELHIATGNLDRAQIVLTRALSIANRIAPDGDIVPEVLRRLAEVALARRDYSAAKELALDAEKRASRLGDRYERATALRVQGEIHRDLGNKEQAAQAFRDALSILEELGEIFERDRIMRLIGGPSRVELAAIADAAREKKPSAPESTRSRIPSSENLRSTELRALLHEHGLIGSSRPLLDLMRQASLVAPIQLPVLIQGETGTGKELLARAIHSMSQGAAGPFVAFNCATCPPDLLDAELFGHARGAFTGAMTARTGLVRHAKGGTLFLDEIGEMREEAQARLLRLLDSGEVRPLGSDQSMQVQVRIIAATHADLRERINLRRFRPDLYFRLAGIRLVLPALRDRSGDVRELVAHFVDEARSHGHPSFAGLGEQALRTMERFDWPGNVRQLKMEIGRLAALTPPGQVVEEWLPLDQGEGMILPMSTPDADQTLRDPERLRRLFKECGGHMPSVARRLGLSRGYLYRVLKRNGIDPKDLRTKVS